ncbi:MAG TPA: hypothetical protein VG777_06870 [Thermoanaerobaculia bacterium]|nr:hypothetical protein [Thermoanaerobaculia bacterium]
MRRTRLGPGGMFTENRRDSGKAVDGRVSDPAVRYLTARETAGDTTRAVSISWRIVWRREHPPSNTAAAIARIAEDSRFISD